MLYQSRNRVVRTLARAALAGVLALALAPDVAWSQVPPPPAPLVPLLDEASHVFPVPYWRLACLAWEESRYRSTVTNPLGYHGLVQFGWPLWQRGVSEARNPADLRYSLVTADSTPYQPREALLLAAYFIARGETTHWPSLRRCP